MHATKRLLLACVSSSYLIDEEVIEVIESEDDDQDADQDADQDVEQEQEDGEMDDWLASDGDVSPVSSSRGDWTDEESFTSSSDIAKMSEEEMQDTPCPAAAAAARRVISDDDDE